MSIKNFFDGGKQISDSVGAPLNGGLCYFYDPGTTTPKNTYTTSALTVANANPVTLDSSGRANIWLNGNYRTIVKDSSGGTIYDEDNINPEAPTSVTAVTSSTTLILGDKGKVIEVNGSGITITLTSAATLGAGWYVDYISTDSTNTFTFGRANGGNTINGSAANLSVYPLQTGRIYVNQAANGFYTESDVSARGTNYWSGATNAFSGVTIAKLPEPSNLRLSASVSSSALTIAIKGNDGNDPSATNNVHIPFRDVTAATGDTVWVSLAAATSIVISSGSTLGATNATAFRGWVVGFNDGGTFRGGVINCSSSSSTATTIYPLADDILASSTAEGGAGAADSAGTIYTGAAVTSKAMRVLGYFEYSSGLTAAGTYDVVPTKIQLWTSGMRLPGDLVQRAMTASGAVSTGTTQLPVDDTIPQNTEGDQYLSQAITPSSAANVLHVNASLNLASSVNNDRGMALFRDTTANALAAIATSVNTVNQGWMAAYKFEYMTLATSVAATTFKVRAGIGAAGTTTFNGAAAARLFGGVAMSYIMVTELMG